MDYSDRRLTKTSVSKIATAYRDGLPYASGTVEATVSNFDGKDEGPIVAIRVQIQIDLATPIQDIERALLDAGASLLIRVGSFEAQEFVDRFERPVAHPVVRTPS